MSRTVRTGMRLQAYNNYFLSLIVNLQHQLLGKNSCEDNFIGKGESTPINMY